MLDYAAISPVVHLDEPVGRGATLERLLDHLEPVFEGELPPDVHVHGPGGAGKSAVVTALVAALDAQVSGRVPIGTATRVEDRAPTGFVYVDGRRATTGFGLYRTVLDGLVDEHVPEQGVGTAALRERLADRLDGRQAVVAVDHVDDPDTLGREEVVDLLDTDALALVTVGRSPVEATATVEVPAYREHALVDVLTERVADGLARHAVEHEQLRRLAGWAEGDAHDALAALFGACDVALSDGRGHLAPGDVEDGMADVPRPGAPLGRVLALPDNRQVVLRHLLELDEADRSSVGRAAEAIAARVDLSAGTVKRLLYELSESGVTERVESSTVSAGRPPSRVEPRFPTRTFRRLYDLA